MKKTVLILGILSSFNANAWEACGTDARGNTANCEYQIIDGTLTIRGTGENGNIGYWYSSEAANFIQPWRDKGVNNIVIDNSIHDLGSFAFSNIQSINPIKIPYNINVISDYAFDRVKTSEIIIPQNTKVINSGAFKSEYLTKINIPDSVQRIYNDAFRGSTGLTDIIFPENIEFIGDKVLSRCLNLKTLTISDKTPLGNIFTGYDYDQDSINLENLKIYCTGDTKKCDDHLKAAGYPELKSIKATTKQVNGVTYILDKKGNIVASSGKRENKRIYSIEEASLVSKKTGNTFRLRYK